MCRAKIKKQNCDLTELRRSHADLLADRDRSLKYNDELEKTIQSMKEINKELKHVMKIFYTVVSPEHFFSVVPLWSFSMSPSVKKGYCGPNQMVYFLIAIG